MNEITGKNLLGKINESNDSEKVFSNINIMNKVELDKRSKSQLINLILQQNKKKL